MTEVATATKAKKEVKAPVEISIKGVLAMLDAGKDREKIKAELGISHSDMALLFKDPALKGRKPKGTVRNKKAPGFVLVQEDGTKVIPTITETVKVPEAGSTDADSTAPTEQAETATAQVTAQAEVLDKW